MVITLSVNPAKWALETQHIQDLPLSCTAKDAADTVEPVYMTSITSNGVVLLVLATSLSRLLSDEKLWF